ncbi:hypothetical protein [Occallatibacter riparius]|uniref:Uncharacterized protein n=1 Tax=Occallatibacter riparius TaxID=1002689 RepID=A0A9J7BWM0_9BACT|nr:hypothetical protein [Occallatibacter riparius]UWZ85270.1 hypothetical protein MOP44_04845 [Occallatibacter riparius]
MIALLTTYFILAYILIPGVLFRVFAGFFVTLRLFQLTKTQEFTLGVLVALLPLVLANVFVWTVPFAEAYPFAYTFGTTNEYKRDYRLAVGMAVAEDPAHLLEPGKEPKSEYEQAVSRIWRRQLRFLSWYFLFSASEGALFGFLTRKYGDWSGKSALYDVLARKVLLPRVSEWQLLLTDFSFPKKPKRDVLADVLCGDILYRGKVGDYFLDVNGKLSGLLMKEVDRFRREDFKAACIEAKGTNEKVDVEKFWRAIPGSNFYIPAENIVNLNVRFPTIDPSKDEEFESFLKELLKSSDAPVGTTFSFDSPDVSSDHPPDPPKDPEQPIDDPEGGPPPPD